MIVVLASCIKSVSLWVVPNVEILGHREECVGHCDPQLANLTQFRTISRRPHPSSCTGSTPASGQAASNSSDRAAAGGSKKAVREGVPAPKIDERLTDRFVVAHCHDGDVDCVAVVVS